MPFDVFISYSRADHAWAEKLESELTFRGYSVFLDKKRITAGDKWDDTLRDSLIESRHLLLIWSDTHAATSDWVKEEAAAFRMLIHQDFRSGTPSKRSFLQLCLEGRSTQHSQFQTISTLSDSVQYPVGADHVDPNVWSRVVEQIVAKVDKGEPFPLVHQVVLASTRAKMEGILDTHRPTVRASSFGELLDHLCLTDRPQLFSRYGDERCDWRPFGSPPNILTVLNGLRAEFNARHVPPFRWKPVGPEFWGGSSQQVKVIVEQLCEEPAIIVLDALSLYDAEVFEQYNRLLECTANDSAAVMVLPPFRLEARHCLRDFLELAIEKLFDQYYRPKIAQGRRILAHCNVLADDEIEMGRLMLHAVCPRSNQRHRALRQR